MHLRYNMLIKHMSFASFFLWVPSSHQASTTVVTCDIYNSNKQKNLEGLQNFFTENTESRHTLGYYQPSDSFIPSRLCRI